MFDEDLSGSGLYFPEERSSTPEGTQGAENLAFCFLCEPGCKDCSDGCKNCAMNCAGCSSCEGCTPGCKNCVGLCAGCATCALVKDLFG